MIKKRQSIFRVVHVKNFTVIDNFISFDERICWRAKGIFSYAFTRKDDWKFYMSDLLRRSVDGRDSVRMGLKALELAGYLTKERSKDAQGRFIGWDYTFHELPLHRNPMPEGFYRKKSKEKLPSDPEFFLDPGPEDFEEEGIECYIDQEEPKKQISVTAEINKNLEKPKTEKPTSVNPPLTNTEYLPNTEKKQQHSVKPVVEKKVCDAVVVFYKCIENIDLTEKQKQSLMKYPEEDVIQAVSFATHPNTKIKTTLIKTIMWAIKAKPELPEMVDVEANKKHSYLGRDILFSDSWDINCSENSVVFTSRNAYCPKQYVLKYSEEDYKGKFNKLLYELQFKKAA